MKMCWPPYLTLFISCTVGIAESQKVLYSSKSLLVHSFMNVSDDVVIATELSEISKEILLIGKTSDLMIKANAYAHHIQTCRDDWSREFNKLYHRERRSGIRWLGELLADSTDMVSPDQWDKSQEVQKDLVAVAKNENEMIKRIKQKIVHDETEMNRFVAKVKEYRATMKNVSNKIENLTVASNKLDTLFAHALTLIHYANLETSKFREIFQAASFHLPSKHLFPYEKIHNFIMTTTELDRVNSHLFFTKSEIVDLYQFQSTITLYDEIRHRIIAVLSLPLVDFSNKMNTLPISTELSNKDLNRIHQLEGFSHGKFSKILCSKSKNSIRILMENELTSCQKHRNKLMYLCSGREIFLKLEEHTDCTKIVNLPKSLAIEIKPNKFLIESLEEKITITCNEKPKQKINPFDCPVVVDLPHNCEIMSKSVTISKGPETTKENNITINNHQPKILVKKIDMDDWKPYKFPSSKNEKNLDEVNFSKNKFDPELDKKTENNLKKLDRDENALNQHEIMSISSISISGVTLALVVISAILYKKFSSCRNPVTSKTYEDKIQELERRLTVNMKELDRQNLGEIIKCLEEVNKKIITEEVKTTFIELVETLKKIN